MLKPYAAIGAQTITRLQPKTRSWKDLIYFSDLMREPCLRGRRKKAAWNDDYMLRIIARQAHA